MESLNLIQAQHDLINARKALKEAERVALNSVEAEYEQIAGLAVCDRAIELSDEILEFNNSTPITEVAAAFKALIEQERHQVIRTGETIAPVELLIAATHALNEYQRLTVMAERKLRSELLAAMDSINKFLPIIN